jgi:hypothetical protein
MSRYIQTVLGYGSNDISIYTIILRKFKLNDIWFQGSQFQILIDFMCLEEDVEFSMIDIDGNKINCNSKNLPKCEDRLNKDNFDIYPDIDIGITLDGNDYEGFICNENFKL